MGDTSAEQPRMLDLKGKTKWCLDSTEKDFQGNAYKFMPKKVEEQKKKYGL
jgi:acyl-CoA-binding protein